MENKNPVDLRDFIYLDVERVRSLLSQLGKGLPTEWQEAIGQTQSNQLRGGAKALIAELGGASDFTVNEETRETKTYHDYVYNLTERHLLDQNMIIRFPDDSTGAALLDKVTRSGLSSVAFVLARGQALISDYGRMRTMLANFGELRRLRHTATYEGRIAEAESEEEREQLVGARDLLIAKAQPDPQQLADFYLMLDVFHKDRLAISILPYRDVPGARVVGPLSKEMLRESLEDIRFKFGSAPAAPWTVFGQIAAIPQADETTKGFSETLPASFERTLNLLSDSLRIMDDEMRVGYPGIAITPIAIYREWLR